MLITHTDTFQLSLNEQAGQREHVKALNLCQLLGVTMDEAEFSKQSTRSSTHSPWWNSDCDCVSVLNEHSSKRWPYAGRTTSWSTYSANEGHCTCQKGMYSALLARLTQMSLEQALLQEGSLQQVLVNKAMFSKKKKELAISSDVECNRRHDAPVSNGGLKLGKVFNNSFRIRLKDNGRRCQLNASKWTMALTE